MSAAEKRAYFEKHDHPTLKGIDEFREYLQRNHQGDVAFYDRGDPPTEDIREIVAWTDRSRGWGPWKWEVRVEDGRVHDALALTRIIWTEASSEAFQRWVIDDSGLDLSAKTNLIDLVARVELICPPTETPHQRAERAIQETR